MVPCGPVHVACRLDPLGTAVGPAPGAATEGPGAVGAMGDGGAATITGPDAATDVLIEDDLAIRVALKRSLTERGHAVLRAADGVSGLASAVRGEPEIVLLDLGLPDIGGLTLLGMLRGASSVPVIVITAQDDRRSIVSALDTGADDYVVKPFGADEIAARIRAVLRRTASGEETEGPLRVGGLEIDPRTREARLDGERLSLSRKEFDLLVLLAGREGEVVTKRELLAEVWQQAFGGADRTVDVHLSWLRRKLGETAAEPRHLHSVRGVGVRLAAPSDP